MNKNRIRLTESQLHRVIKESVKKVLRESKYTPSDFDNLTDFDDLEAYNDYIFPDATQDWVVDRANFPQGKDGDNEYSWALMGLRDMVNDDRMPSLPNDYSMHLLKSRIRRRH